MGRLLTAEGGTAESLPVHVAVIPDGNGRWAQSRGLPRIDGHREGARSVDVVISSALEARVPWLSLYLFSTENWDRPVDEVTGIHGLIADHLQRNTKRLVSEGVSVRVRGCGMARLPHELQAAVREAERRTADNDRLGLQVLIDYGGRQDIVTAARQILRRVRDGAVRSDAISEHAVRAELTTSWAPEPDLIIRTGCEMRLSNFMLWEAAWAELAFTDVLWPDFREEAFQQCVEAYRQRAAAVPEGSDLTVRTIGAGSPSGAGAVRGGGEVGPVAK